GHPDPGTAPALRGTRRGRRRRPARIGSAPPAGGSPHVRVVGIELEPRAFRLVLLDGAGKRWRVAGLACETLPSAAEGEEPQAALAAAVENAFRRLKAPRDPVVATFPSSECVFRNLLLPFKGEEPIRKVLKFESEGHLHHWNIDEIVVDYLP